jgi:hypothetical protein
MPTAEAAVGEVVKPAGMRTRPAGTALS